MQNLICAVQNTAPAPPSMQAVALRVTSDYAAFHDCTIIGNQDSLYDHNGRHYYASFKAALTSSSGMNCELNVMQTLWGAVTAHKRQNATNNTGFAFQNCRITGAEQVYLGRAWGPFSRVVYTDTWMCDVIYAPGWFDWGQMSVYYGQYRCSGPGLVGWPGHGGSRTAKPHCSCRSVSWMAKLGFRRT